MSTYLVLKRMKQQGEDHMPQTLVTNPENAQILMERGFITPVPDNFTPPDDTKRIGPTKAKVAPKGKAAVSIGDAPSLGDGSATTEDSPLPTVDQLLEAGYSREAAKAMVAGENSALVEKETKALEEAVNARPDILELARATEEKVSVLAELDDKDYKELVREYLGGTVGAAAGDGGTSAAT